MSARILAISDSTLCKEPLLDRLRTLAEAGVSAIILREKHLDELAYYELAKSALAVLKPYKMPCILHNFAEVAIRLRASAYHATSAESSELPRYRKHFQLLGASIHSVEQYYSVREWVDYMVVGHIFESSCKAGLVPKGVGVLREICALDSVWLDSARVESRGVGYARECAASRGCATLLFASGRIFAIGGIMLHTLPTLRSLFMATINPRTINTHTTRESTAIKSMDSRAVDSSGNYAARDDMRAIGRLGGVCMRQALMECENPAGYLAACFKVLEKS